MALFQRNSSLADSDAGQISRAIERLAHGDLTGTFSGSSKLLAHVAPAISTLQAELLRQRAETAALKAALAETATLSSAVAEMKQQQESGAADFRVDADSLSEPCRSIARNINALMTSHGDAQAQLTKIVCDYAQGDFSADLKRLPGNTPRLEAAFATTKNAFRSGIKQTAELEEFNAAVAEMTKKHALGWIDHALPVDAFSAGFKQSAESVNALVGRHIGIKMKIIRLVKAYAAGDFSEEMESLPAGNAKINEAMDQVRAAFPKPDHTAAMKRIAATLENVTANVMIADASNVICYMNRATTEMMRNAERDLQKDLPNLHVDRLIGTKIDEFHKVPARQTRMLAELRGTHRAEIVVGGRTFSLIANPIVDESGTRLGAVVEWKDRTLEVLVEGETANIVAAASNGDFSKRLNTADKAGFFKQLAENINSLVETCDVSLNEVVRVLSALAKGDLTQTISGEYSGTFGRLKDDCNATVASLTRTVIDIKDAAETVSTSSREISSGNTDLSQRTEEQAASLEETASSLEELTTTVRQNTENAKQANRLAIGASDIAVKGGVVVGEVVSTMAAINASAKKIVDIISVIDGIAFQTNILALNAAVEAARAGEQGRGFAVVAGEVRTLAQRSAAAAKEIKGLIGDSVDKTATGSMLVDQAGQTMAEIVASVKRVTDIMAAISAASEEQGSGIEQVNEATNQMDRVTQQNAALVEEVAASAESLEERAATLVRLVGVFTLGGSSHSTARPIATRPVAAPRPAPAPRPSGAAPRASTPARAATPSSAAPKRAAVADPSALSRVGVAPAGDDAEWTSF